MLCLRVVGLLISLTSLFFYLFFWLKHFPESVKLFGFVYSRMISMCQINDLLAKLTLFRECLCKFRNCPSRIQHFIGRMHRAIHYKEMQINQSISRKPSKKHEGSHVAYVLVPSAKICNTTSVSTGGTAWKVFGGGLRHQKHTQKFRTYTMWRGIFFKSEKKNITHVDGVQRATAEI